MIWNLSEHNYDTVPFNNNVIEYYFPGLPVPPLRALFEFCCGLKAWLDSDPANVAALHCQASRGRSAMYLACYLS